LATTQSKESAVKIDPYIFFNGQCEEAFKFYEKTLGGKIEAMMPNEGSPAAGHVPPEWGKKILHARIVIDGQAIMASDAPPDRAQKTGGYSLSISLKDPAEAERIFNALAKDGQINMPIQETFWALRFGMLVDRFGIPWMVNCEKPA
jgi:PhnB protein